MNDGAKNRLKARRLGIDTQSEMVVFMHRDSLVCRSEGFSAHNRVLLTSGDHHVIATLYQVSSNNLAIDEAGLSESAWEHLHLSAGDCLTVAHPEPLESLSLLRSRLYGHRLSENAMHAIIRDIVERRYSDIHTSAFVAACASPTLDRHETLALTRAMVDAGERLTWTSDVIADKHSVGGLPGNRTTPLVVSIVAALGLIIPKTSSRAITSPAGTADTMETLAPVDLPLRDMHRVVEKEGGCIVWGGAVKLSPADDILIRVERALDLDTEGQMIASVMSKKIAAGSTHLVIDMPIGPTAKVRSEAAAKNLSDGLLAVADAFGIKVKILPGDGTQPIGRGIGPALEALDLLAVFQQKPDRPRDLEARAVALAGALLELTGNAAEGEGQALAMRTLTNGQAWAKFQRICEAQGGMRTPPQSRHRHVLTATREGVLKTMDNRKIANLAKLAGAPEDKCSGVALHVRLNDRVVVGQPLCTLHAEAEGELDYALAYAGSENGIFGIVEG